MTRHRAKRKRQSILVADDAIAQCALRFTDTRTAVRYRAGGKAMRL